MIEYVEWDSRFFGRNIGRIDLDPSGLPDTDVFISEARKFDLIYVNSRSFMLPGDMVRGMNLDLMDIMLTLSMPVNREIGYSKEKTMRTSLSAEELQQCYRISEQISEVSRFTKEPLIGPTKTKSLYRAWIDNSLNSSYADGIFLFKKDGVIRGIHIIKSDAGRQAGRCSLIGLDKNLRKTGGGTTLWNQALAYWVHQTGVNKAVYHFR